MFNFRGILTLQLLSIVLIQIIDAGYTSEETNEKSKSLFNAVSSILESTESRKHQHKQMFDSPTCTSARCPSDGATYGVGNGPSGYVASRSPCNSPTGCPPNVQSSQYGNVNVYDVTPGVASASGSIQPANTKWDNNIPTQSSSSFGHLPYVYQGSAGSYGQMPHQAPSHVYGSTGSFGSVPQTASYQATPRPFVSVGYNQPDAYGHMNNHPNHSGYQGPRGYSVFDHSLKTNSQYIEVGSHSGPLQQAANGYGYGSGYGGYNGLFNRPGF